MKRILTALSFVLLPALASAQVSPSTFGGVNAPIFGLPAVNGGNITPGSVGFPATTCAAPGIYYTAGVTTGIAFTATPSVILCVNGTAVVTTTSTAVTSTVPLVLPNGSAAAAALGFTSGVNTGLFSDGSTLFVTAQAVSPVSFGAGVLSMAAATTLGWTPTTSGAAQDVSLSRGAANRLDLATADSFNMVGGGASFQMATVPIISSTAPTVSSAGTSPSVAGTNTAAFRVNVGTGGTATTIVLTMPTATTGWNCFAENITAGAANRANQRVVMTASTTTSITVQNQTISTGAALAFTASDIVAFVCHAY